MENNSEIDTLFEFPSDNQIAFLYKEAIKQNLMKVLPQPLLLPNQDENSDDLEDQRQDFFSSLPLVWSTNCTKAPGTLSFFLISKLRPSGFKFFFDMLSHWLIPGKVLNVILIYAIDFRLKSIDNTLFTFCELMIRLETAEDLKQVQRNFPTLQTEIRLGVESSYYARRILEIRGLPTDTKIVMIHEYIAHLLSKRPNVFDYEIISEMQHIMVICREEFKALRDSRHFCRIISAHYLYRKAIRTALHQEPEKRHLHLKLFKSNIHPQTGDKVVLGIVVGLNFLNSTEVFEERHLLSAVQNYLPDTQVVEGSFFMNRHGAEKISTFYMEIEKIGGEEFTPDEIKKLRKELPGDLKDRIEHLLHPVFMPRNEEEIMRNILSLSNQIKYLHDLPQVILSFDEQTQTHLIFTVIIVRVTKPGAPSIQECFKVTSKVEYSPDRVRIVGFLRKKYPKEATVFHIKLPKEAFLRKNHSIDLNKARQAVLQEIIRAIGDVRDFNGGMISKQHELLCAVREQLSHQVKYSELLLENFFYSLTPDVMRTVLDPKALKTLFLLFHQSIAQGLFNEPKNYSLNTVIEANAVFALVKSEDRTVKETISRSLHRLELPTSKLASSFVSVYDTSYVGYLYLCDEIDKQQQFCQALQSAIDTLEKKSRN